MDIYTPDSTKVPTKQTQKGKGRGKGKGPTKRDEKCPRTQSRVSPLRGVGTRMPPRETPVFDFNAESTGNFIGKSMLSEHKSSGLYGPLREVVNSIGVGKPTSDSFATPSDTLCEKFWICKVMHYINHGQGKVYCV